MVLNAERLKNIIDNISVSFLLSFLVVSSVLLFKPLSIILGNPSDFMSPPNELASYYLSGMSIYLMVLFIISLFIISINKLKSSYVAILFSIGLLFFIQSNILNWDYGLLDGRDIPWNTFWYRELVDIIIWSGTLFLIFIKRKFLLKHIKIYALALILIQAVPVASGLLNDMNTGNGDNSSSTANYSIDESKKFVFSKNKNIFVFVLDAISDSVFADVLNENPDLVRELDGFIRFDNVLGAGGYTFFSVPSYFTGIPYLNNMTFNEYSVNAFNGDGSLLKQLRDKGWNTGFHKPRIFKKASISPKLLTEIKSDGDKLRFSDPDLKELSLYVNSPQVLKRWFYDIFELASFWEGESQNTTLDSKAITRKSEMIPFPNNSNDLKFINNMLSNASVSYTQPTFKYYHIKGAHVPYLLDKKFKKKQSNYKDAIYVSLKIAVRFINILKELDVYDSSQIYIMADHGSYPLSSITKEVKKFSTKEYPIRAAPMFMFKDFSTKGDLIINSTPLSYYDFPSIVTVFSDNTSSTKNLSLLKHFAKNKRKFYSFSNTAGSYYPKIVELQVEGNVNNPQSWSLTGREFIPSTVKPKRKFNCINDVLSLNNRDEFLHYVPQNLLDCSGFTRGRKVEFFLPLKNDCVDDDILIRIKMAAVLGTNTKTGEEVSSRTFKIVLNGDFGFMSSDSQQVNTEEFNEFSFLIERKFIKDGSINFTLDLPDSIKCRKIIDKKGKVGWGSSLRLDSLTISKAVNGTDYIKLKPNKEYNNYMQRRADIKNIKKALDKFHKKNGYYPKSSGWDGLCSKWGKSTPEYIKGLAPNFMESLPFDPRNSEVCRKNYLYKSDGKNYKFIVHSAPKFDLSRVEKILIDPKRTLWAYGIWTKEAKNW